MKYQLLTWVNAEDKEINRRPIAFEIVDMEEESSVQFLAIDSKKWYLDGGIVGTRVCFHYYNDAVKQFRQQILETIAQYLPQISDGRMVISHKRKKP